jgi:tripartite-type tricarboxylate transporter receptor subunit TctC
MITKRNLARSAAALGLAMLGLATPAAAQAPAAFPTRPVSIVMPYPPGNAIDLLARALAAAMQPVLGQSVVVLNRDGAAGSVGSTFAARSAPDGYTVLFAPALVASTLPIVMPSAGLQTNSFQPICQVFNNSMALVVKPDSPIRTLRDLQVAAQARPGRVTYGTLGVTSIPHLAMVQWAAAARAEVEHVPYRADGMVMTEVLAGRIEVGSIVLGSAAGRGDLRVLAVFDQQRHPDFPNAPTAIEQGFAVSPASFGGLLVPTGTPEDRIAILEAACTTAAASDTYRNAARTGSQPTNFFLSRADFTRRLAEDIAQKGELLRGITLN